MTQLEDQTHILNYPSTLNPELIKLLEKGIDVTVERPEEIVLWGQCTCQATSPLKVGGKAFLKGNAQHIRLQYYAALAPEAPLTTLQKVKNVFRAFGWVPASMLFMIFLLLKCHNPY